MARVPDLIPYCERHGLKMITVADLVEHRRRTEKLVHRGAVGAPADGVRRVPGDRLRREAHRQGARRARPRRRRRRRERARARALRVPHRRRLPLAALRLRRAARAGARADRARGSRRAASTWRRRGAASACSTSSRPTRCRRRGSTRSRPTSQLGFPADARDYGIGNQILADLGLSTIRILTNNPKKLTGIDGFGLTVVEQVPIEVAPNEENRRYLAAKRDKLGHRLHHQDLRINPEWDETTEKDDERTRRRGRAARPGGRRRRGSGESHPSSTTSRPTRSPRGRRPTARDFVEDPLPTGRRVQHAGGRDRRPRRLHGARGHARAATAARSPSSSRASTAS